MQKAENFRDFVPAADHPKVIGLEKVDAREWGRRAENHPVIGPVLKDWLSLAETPFKGITTDGKLYNGLFHKENQGAPIEAMVKAVHNLAGLLTLEQKKKLFYPFTAREKRRWSNPELLIFDNGLRLEDLSESTKAGVYKVLEASLSPRGYKKTVNCMRMNHFLGELCHCNGIMNEHSYNFLMFGEASMTAPWGWMIYGHHMCLNVFVQGTQMVISPTFMGAEPNIIDDGPWKGTVIFRNEEERGLQLMQSLTKEQQAVAQLYKQMDDPAMPAGRIHAGDQRHLGGAFQDNRIIPYEGINVSTLSHKQQELAISCIEAFNEYLPDGPLKHKLDLARKHIKETYFCWIGGFGEHDPFYYRIQSPVAFVEFDHHSAVWLLNDHPAKFHTHTVVRTPNGGDYGEALCKLSTKL